MRRAFGAEMSHAEIQRLMHAFYRHLGLGIVEFVRALRVSDSEIRKILRLSGTSHLDAALAQGRGGIIVSAHTGNWEMSVRGLILAGYRIHAIARTQSDQTFAGLLDRSRSQAGLGLIPKRGAVRAAQERLARNEFVIFVVDEDAGRRGVFAPFFGHLASTAVGPAVVAARSGAPVIPGFAYRNADGTHTVFVAPALKLRFTGDERKDAEVNTAIIAQAVEQGIRRHPEQWLWVKRRWRTRPPEERASEVKS
jgi:KDO2-lipid IV(A) lauroyltransferase